jgi:hypothetical protein
MALALMVGAYAAPDRQTTCGTQGRRSAAFQDYRTSEPPLLRTRLLALTLLANTMLATPNR